MWRKAQPGKWFTRQLAGPVIAAALVRLDLLAVVLERSGSGALYRPDTLSYLEPGRNLLLHGRFAEAGLPDIARTPGYALFLALACLAGPIVAAIAQVILSAFSTVLVWRLARTVFSDRRIAIGAAWIFAFEPLSVIYSILLLSETVFLALFLMSLIRLAEFLRGRSLRALAGAGIWLAAATFVRPVTYYLPVALAAGLMVVLAHVKGLRWKAPAVLLLSVLPWLAAWQIRNFIETGFAGFSSIQTENLYFFSAAEVTSRADHRLLADVQNDLGYNDDQLFLLRHPQAAEWNQAQRLKFMRAEVKPILKAHPWLFLSTHLAGSIRTVLNPGAAVLLDLVRAPADDQAFTREREQGPVRAAIWMAQNHPWQIVAMAALGTLPLGLYVLAFFGFAQSAAPSACREHDQERDSRGRLVSGHDFSRAKKGDKKWALAPAEQRPLSTTPFEKHALWLLLGVSLYFFAVSGGAVAAARLRLPVMPIVSVLAAAGAVHTVRKRNATQFKRQQ